ncbi:uncharacterized protein BO87DRAFT_445843 [Aspergillus neoniger CBS 115656]|uniref:Terpenoid synthase n=1 Tax=Aspergillus neoniger (strain CBS 115656) TaxID=1448310 RepID=A0A318YUT6_ASPNB|nr:hypothetical protein BO87DRAFT_445843 [Aspergillus neoniger CBS 115656]PYH38074.1 hypothetical protein BO87DRAFT_445843 [Aspergillus neoniger CBS 115656]
MKIDFFSALSRPEYECLEFHDETNLSTQQRNEVFQCVRKCLFLLLEGIGHQQQAIPADERLRHNLHNWVQEHLTHLFPENLQALEVLIDTSAQVGEYFYAHCSHETKLVMAITSLILFASDDDTLLSPEERNRLSSFSCNDGYSPPDASPWTAVLTHGLQLGAEYFGSQDPLVGSLSANAIRGFTEACTMECRMEQGDLPVHLTTHEKPHPSSECCAAEAFPGYLRSLSGISFHYIPPIFKYSRTEEVPSSYWLGVAPVVRNFIDYTNDLLSYPKEVLDGEIRNYLLLATRARRVAGRSSRFGSKSWTFRDTFCETLENVQNIVLALDKAVTSYMPADNNAPEDGNKTQDDPNAQLAAKCWFSFRQNFISFHLESKRYGLDRLAFERNNYTVEELCAPKHKPMHSACVGAAAAGLFLISALGYSYFRK